MQGVHVERVGFGTVGEYNRRDYAGEWILWLYIQLFNNIASVYVTISMNRWIRANFRRTETEQFKIVLKILSV